MGDYNCDGYVNIPQLGDLSRAKNFCSDFPVFSDQWSIDSAHRVSSFADGNNRIRVKILFDPRLVP